MPLSEQDGFEHGQQGIGGTAAVVSDVTGSLTIQVLLDRLPILLPDTKSTRVSLGGKQDARAFWQACSAKSFRLPPASLLTRGLEKRVGR